VRESRDTRFRCSCLRELLRNSISSTCQSVLLADGIFSAVKSARAPRRLENVRNCWAMFYLNGRDDTAAKYDSSSSNGEENFGWWLNNREITTILSKSHHVRDHRSLGSSILSCMDSDDSDSCSFARDVSCKEQESEISENIELISFNQNDLDIDLIERDARETVSVRLY